MKYTFVGPHPEDLASGRPLVFGDVVDESALTPADDRLKRRLIPVQEAPAPKPVVALASAPEPEPTPTPETK